MHRTLRILVVIAVLVGLVATSRVARGASGEKVGVAVIELEGKLAERAKVMMPFGKSEPTLRDATAALTELAGRSDIRAVLIKLREAQLSVTQVQELGDAIAAVRGAGKKVHLY